SHSQNGARMRGCRSADPALPATSTCAASVCFRTAFPPSRRTGAATSRNSIRSPRATSRFTAEQTRFATARRCWGVRYALLGFRAGFEFDGGSIFLDARNITDEKYIASTSVIPVVSPTSALFEPGDGASVYVGVRSEERRVGN